MDSVGERKSVKFRLGFSTRTPILCMAHFEMSGIAFTHVSILIPTVLFWGYVGIRGEGTTFDMVCDRGLSTW